MTLENLLLQNLDKWRPQGRSTLSFDHPESGWRVTLDAGCVDTIGVQLHTLWLGRLQPMPPGPSLREQAEAIARNVTGLLEPLRLVEVDETHGVAQLRSDAPAVRGEAKRYYELLRHGSGTTTLSRYEAGPGPRQPVGFTLTHEAMSKLVRDLAG
jgi:hypothetical protein